MSRLRRKRALSYGNSPTRRGGAQNLCTVHICIIAHRLVLLGRISCNSNILRIGHTCEVLQ